MMGIIALCLSTFSFILSVYLFMLKAFEDHNIRQFLKQLNDIGCLYQIEDGYVTIIGQNSQGEEFILHDVYLRDWMSRSFTLMKIQDYMEEK
jgi:hypothetical protein